MFWVLRLFIATEREKQLAADLDAALRELKVVEAERDVMAAVIVRDRQRVLAESSEYARRRAEAEGVPDARRGD